MSSLLEEVQSLVFDGQQTETVTKSVTLATLLKMIASLKQHQAGGSNPYTNKKKKASRYDEWGSVPSSFHSTSRTIDITQLVLKNAGTNLHDETQADYHKMSEEIKKGFLSTQKISYDISQLEVQLRKANVACGVHEIVMSLEFVSSSLTMLSQFLTDSDKANFSVHDVVRAYESYVGKSDVASTAFKPTMTVNVYDTKELETKIKKLKCLKEKLISKRDMLNNTTKVEIHLSKDSVEILGLDSQ